MNMKKRRITIFLLALVLSLTMGVASINVRAEDNIERIERALIPQPSSYNVFDGKFVLTENTSIYVKGNSESETEELNQIGELLAKILRKSTGYSIEVIEGEAANGDIQLTTVDGDTSLKDEGYTITVTTDSVKIAAPKTAGVYRGTQTLRQLLPADIEKSEIVNDVEWNIPVSTIEDSPRYDYRGTHLDVARHFRTVEEVKRHIDNIAQYKINVLHLHLTDDQGWRLEIKGERYGESYEKLLTIGAQSSCNGDPGGYYTQEEYKDIVDYAAQRYIEIVPEFDMPGHTGAALASLDFLSPDGKPLDAPTQDYTVGKTTFNCRLEATYEFVEDVIAQMAELSSSKYIHIGGDEANSTSSDDYNYFMSRVTEIAKKYGKIPMGWQNYDQTDGTDESVVQFWETRTSATISNPNMKILMSPANKAYLDMQYPTNSDWGLSWAGKISIQAGYEWDPTDYTKFNQDNIIGIEAPLWSETISSVAGVDHLAFPRLLGIAEIGWSQKEDRNWTEYKERLVAHADRLTNEGIGFYRDPQVFGLPTYNDPITIPNKFDTYLTGLADGMNVSYKLNVEKAGTYMVELNYSTDNIWSINGQKIALSIDGEKVDEKNLAVTWSGNGAVIMPITVSEGEHTLKLDFFASSYALNYINIYEAPVVQIPGNVEAEDYVNSKGINHEPRGNRYTVSETNTGDFLEYKIDVAKTGTYTLALNAAAQGGNAEADIYVDGVKVGNLSSVDTGSWSNYIIQEASNEFELIKGEHTLKIDFTNVNGGTNIDYLVFTAINYAGENTDKTALQITVDTANTLKAQGALDNVVPAVAAEFETALANAEAVLVDDSADQTTIDTSFYRLANAIHMLEFVKGDKSALEALINEAEKYEEENYTTDSWTAFKEALDAARDVMNDENALESDVNEALNNLTEAIGNLVLRADKTRLQEAYDMVNGLDKSLYTEASVAGLTDPMEAAKAVLENPDATQEEVDAAYEALIRAYLDLRLIPNKDLLQGLINKAETLNATNYSAKTWSVMMEALDEAKAVLDDPKATQAEVDNAKEVLAKAMAGLEVNNPVKAGDTTASVATGDNGLIGIFASLSVLSFAGLSLLRKKEN